MPLRTIETGDPALLSCPLELCGGGTVGVALRSSGSPAHLASPDSRGSTEKRFKCSASTRGTRSSSWRTVCAAPSALHLSQDLVISSSWGGRQGGHGQGWTRWRRQHATLFC